MIGKQVRACGGDNIHAQALKNTAAASSVPLNLLFQGTICNKALPIDWLTALIRALFKKGDRSEPGYYRPVSLTSQVCKIIETIVRGHIG